MIAPFTIYLQMILGALFHERQLGIHKQLLFYGVDYKHIYLGSYMIDVALLIVINGVLILFFNISGLSQNQMDGLWLPLLLYMFAQPLSNYFTLSFFRKSKGSVGVVLLQYFCGAWFCIVAGMMGMG